MVQHDPNAVIAEADQAQRATIPTSLGRGLPEPARPATDGSLTCCGRRGAGPILPDLHQGGGGGKPRDSASLSGQSSVRQH